MLVFGWMTGIGLCVAMAGCAGPGYVAIGLFQINPEDIEEPVTSVAVRGFGILMTRHATSVGFADFKLVVADLDHPGYRVQTQLVGLSIGSAAEADARVFVSGKRDDSTGSASCD